MTLSDPSQEIDDDGRLTFLIAPEDSGARLDKWLSERTEYTRTRLKSLIETGAILRGGEIFTDPSWRLREGETFALILPPIEDPTPKGENISLEIAYEDADLIIIDKPAGMVVHPAAGNWSGTLVNALIHHCGKSLSGIGGVARPGIVHRLDKDTSGLLVAAKNDRAHQHLTKAFSVHDVERVYHAVAIGAPRPGIGTINAALARTGADRKKMSIVEAFVQNPDGDWIPRDGAKNAVTHYKVLDRFGMTRAKLKGDAVAALIECRLETGRTHQIRAHLSHIGCPLVGDPLYGRGPGLPGLKPGDEAADHCIAVLKRFRRQALHAGVLGFSHPVSGEDLRFESSPPADFLALTSALAAL